MDWTPLERLIETHDRFLVTTHVRPDGDALGSEVGMVGLLRQRGKDVRVVNSSRTPPRYDFLDPDGTLFEKFGTTVRPEDLADRQTLVILDLSSWSQLGDMADYVRGFAGPRLVIDHHVSQDDLGAVAYLKDTSAEAAGTLVLRACRALGAELTPEMASGLLTAIAMDTGWFRHPSTKPSTFHDAADLLGAGAEVDRLYRLLFERNTLGRMKLMGEALAGLQSAPDGRIVWIPITQEMLHRTGAIPPDTEDVVDFTVSVRGAEVGLLFLELDQGGVKVSARSREGFDCAALLRQFGGGGHRAAAGATLHEPIQKATETVVAAVERALGSK